MRKIIYPSIIILFFGSFVEADGKGLFFDRGFRQGVCYSHPAIRKCHTSDRFKCTLEVFPKTAGRLIFDLNSAKDFLIDKQESSDYGVFTFRVINFDKEYIPKIEILKIQRVKLEDWDKIQDDRPVAKAVPCSS